MGIFYYIHAVALAEDLPHVSEENEHDIDKFYAEIDRGYTQVGRTSVVFRVWFCQFFTVMTCKCVFRMRTTVGLQPVCTWSH